MRSPPQRLATHAPPGALLKRLFALRRIQRADPGSEPSYLWKIRQLPCLFCGVEGFTEACHVRMQSGAHGKHGGIGKKPSDNWTVPLCSEHHRYQHRHPFGEVGFWTEVGINPLLVCERLYAARGDLVRMRAIVVQAIAERE